MTSTTATLYAGPTYATYRHSLAETWLPAFRQECANADRLLQLALKRKNGPDKEALFAGHFAVLLELARTVQTVTNLGGLPLLWEGSAALKGSTA
ncbi:hypothetical protein [Paracidovorax wautersii]|uniref:Uncharacterized protein n=1 Tax=Paracidovorax wautersii TaxID=1177982 RepID=A0A1I2E5W6_9BURK|nr:hypothetical protein [Paracidovorax wautersii]SFE88344.1 hypothetical protein SAMN04489711_106254 [Paracidovorax wautersii]